MSNKAIQITDANFKELIIEAKLPALVEAWHPGCGPCKPFAVIVEQIAGEFEGKMVVAQMNTDEAPLATAQLNVSGVPSLFFFFESKMVKHEFGPKTVGEMRQVCEAFFTYCTANAEAQRAYAEALAKAVEKREAGMKAWHEYVDVAEKKFPESQVAIDKRVPLDAYLAKELAGKQAELDAGKLTAAEFKQFYNVAFNELMKNPPEEMVADCRAWHNAVMAKMMVIQPEMPKWNQVLAKVFDQYKADVEEAERQLSAAIAAS
jgi:thioredoxin 1